MFEPLTTMHAGAGGTADQDVVAHRVFVRNQRMAERDGFEHGPVHRQFRKRIRRMLEGVSRQRRQRLNLADGAKPLADGRAVADVPAIDRHRQLRLDEQQVRRSARTSCCASSPPTTPGVSAARCGATRRRRW